MGGATMTRTVCRYQNHPNHFCSVSGEYCDTIEIEQTRCAGSDCIIDPFWSDGATEVVCFGCNQLVDLYTDGPNLRLRDHLRDV